MREVLTWFALAGAAVSFAALLVVGATWLVDLMRRTPWVSLVVTLFFSGVAVRYSGAKPGSTNEPPRSGNVELRSLQYPQFPTSAVRAENWWRRGAWEDMLRVEFAPGWVFPFGSNHLSSVDVVSQGSVRTRWTDTNEVASTGIPLLLVPFQTEFAHGHTPTNSYRLEWRNALANGNPDSPVDASVELFRDGAVVIETNGVSWREERPWVYGATNAAMSRAEAESMVGGNGMFAFVAEFSEAPPEAVCLCVGNSRVAVSGAGEYCFVLEKGTRHAVSLSFAPDGVSFSWFDAPGGQTRLRSPPLRAGVFTDHIDAYGSSGEVEFVNPLWNNAGSVLWECSLYISPDSVDDPTYPQNFHAWMDIPFLANPSVTWRSCDGSLSASGDWLTLWEDPCVDFIEVTATWNGKMWRGYLHFWTEPDATKVFLDGGGTLFVESAYTNYPGEVTVRTSTQEKLTAYWALREDGTLTLSATEGAAVSVRRDSPAGPVIGLPYSWSVGMGVGSMDFYVTNNDPSRAGEPVEFCLEFDGDDGDYDCDWSGPLDVVKYRVEALADWPSNKVRHVFGPLETFKAIIENGPEFMFDAPLTPGEHSVSFSCNGSSCSVPIRVVAPKGEAGYWRADDFECSGSDIGAGFFADVQVLPTYVSFNGLEIMEDVAGVSGRWGCFENLWKYPESQFAHTPARGARNPLPIGAENKINGYDHAHTILGELPSDNGGFALNIPLKWGISGGPCIYDAGYVLQTTSVQTNGNVTISKFGITRGREPYGLYEGN